MINQVFRLPSGWITLCFFSLFSLIALASTNPEQVGPSSYNKQATHVITPFTNEIKIGRNIQYAANNTRSPLEIVNIPNEEWQTNIRDTISLGYQTQPIWFVVNIKTQPDIAPYWIFELGNTMTDHISLFLFKNGEQQQQWHTGDNQPFWERPLHSTRFQFPLELQANSDYQIFLRVESTETFAMPMLLAERSAFSLMSDQRSLVDGIFLGFLIIMAAYSLSIYVIVKDKSYLFYSLYVASMLLYFLNQQGLMYQHFFPDYPVIQHYIIPWISLLIFISIALFFQSFLSFSKNSPRVWLGYKILLAIHTALCVALFFSQYQIIISLMALNVSLSMVLAVSGLVIMAKQGSRSAQLVLIGWGTLFSCLLLFVFAYTGIFYSEFFAEYGLRVGISLEILIFSYALSYRINQEREEKEWALNTINAERAERIQAQELALQREIEAREAKDQSLQIEIHHRENLQKEVEERTADLERAMQDLEKANKELEQLSSKDALTGLFNRRMFDERLSELWDELNRKNQPLSLLIIDADHFKHINDNMGHLCGDMVLRELAQLLCSQLHRPSDVVTRYGGEEFAILLPDTPLEGAEYIANLLVKNIANYLFSWEGDSFHVTASIGVHSMIPDANADCNSLVECADQALYSAKSLGRNRSCTYKPLTGSATGQPS